MDKRKAALKAAKQKKKEGNYMKTQDGIVVCLAF